MQPNNLIEDLDMKPQRIDINFWEPQVMAILNVTPDSFYSESRAFELSEIEQRVAQILLEGATIIDIGGYSSRPDADDISIDEEWRRVEMALGVVRRVAPFMTVSIDTFRAEIAERAIEMFGAVIINDISAGELDHRLMSVAAKYKVPYLAMHMRGTPKTMQQQCSYVDVVEEVVQYFKAKIEQLKELGVKDIIIDPGFGFAKSMEQNYALMSGLNRMKELGYPILVGVSRKSMIYKLLSVTPEESLTGTIALNWEALRQGATLLRVHDVRQAVECVTIYKQMFEL